MSISVSQGLRLSGKLAAGPNVNTSYHKTKQFENSAVWTSVVSGYRIQKVTLDLFILFYFIQFSRSFSILGKVFLLCVFRVMNTMNT